MSISTRDRRVSVYPYSPTVTDGYANNAYGAKRGTFWCRISPIAGAEATAAGQADHRERAVFEFSDLVTVAVNDLLIDPNSVQWKVESVTPRRVLRQLLVRAYRSDDHPAASLG